MRLRQRAGPAGALPAEADLCHALLTGTLVATVAILMAGVVWAGPVQAPADSASRAAAPPTAGAVYSRDDEGRITLHATRVDTGVGARRRARRSGVCHRPRRRAVLSAGARRGAAHDRTHVRVAPLRSRSPLHHRALPRQPTLAHRRQRHAARRAQRRAERQSERHHRHLPRSTERLRIPRRCRRRHARQPDHRRARHQSRLECGLAIQEPHGRAQGGDVEIAIPFRSLRYREGGPQVWGINIRRTIRWKNEFAYVSPVPRRDGPRGILRLSSAATLAGFEAPPPFDRSRRQALRARQRQGRSRGRSHVPSRPGVSMPASTPNMA